MELEYLSYSTVNGRTHSVHYPTGLAFHWQKKNEKRKMFEMDLFVTICAIQYLDVPNEWVLI